MIPYLTSNLIIIFLPYLLYSLNSSNEHAVVKRQIDDQLKIIGYHIIESGKEPELEDGIPIIKAGSKLKLRLFGMGFSNKTIIGLTGEALAYGEKCHKIVTDTNKVSAWDFHKSALIIS